MSILTTLLLAVVVALCLRDTVAVNIVLEASNVGSRRQWGDNDVLLTCSSVDEGPAYPIYYAIFTRDQVPITISDDDDCTLGDDQYCYVNGGERLSFTANSTTEGKYACKDQLQGQASNELAIVGK